MINQKKPPYYSLRDFLKIRFKNELRKLPIHTNLGCPHRNEHNQGCYYCTNESFSREENQNLSVKEQIENMIHKARKWNYQGDFLAYFQTETNTFTDSENFKKLLEPLSDFKNDIKAVSVSTRPDCLNEEKIGIINSLSKDFLVFLELGLQSTHDRTLKLINRGHDLDSFLSCLHMLKKHSQILTCVHLILGLPGESLDDMISTIQLMNKLQIHGVKLHHLEIVKNTVFHEWFLDNKIKTMDLTEYLNVICQVLGHLSKDIVVHRLLGDVNEAYLVAPKWPHGKTTVIQLIEKKMNSLNYVQSCLKR